MNYWFFYQGHSLPIQMIPNLNWGDVNFVYFMEGIMLAFWTSKLDKMQNWKMTLLQKKSQKNTFSEPNLDLKLQNDFWEDWGSHKIRKSENCQNIPNEPFLLISQFHTLPRKDWFRQNRHDRSHMHLWCVQQKKDISHYNMAGLYDNYLIQDHRNLMKLITINVMCVNIEY